jgi:chromosome segregation ATPase
MTAEANIFGPPTDAAPLEVPTLTDVVVPVQDFAAIIRQAGGTRSTMLSRIYDAAQRMKGLFADPKLRLQAAITALGETITFQELDAAVVEHIGDIDAQERILTKAATQDLRADREELQRKIREREQAIIEAERVIEELKDTVAQCNDDITHLRGEIAENQTAVFAVQERVRQAAREVRTDFQRRQMSIISAFNK